MRAEHGQTPIPLPQPISDARFIGRFSRDVRKAIAALRDRRIVVKGGARAGGAGHPFKITGIDVSGTPAIRVSPGVLTAQSFFADDNYLAIRGSGKEIATTINSFSLDNDLGYLTVSVSTTYGVFILADLDIAAGTPFTDGSGGSVGVDIGGAAVVISSTHTTAASLNTITTAGAYSGFCGWYLGKIEVDADGAIAVTQYRKSDICWTGPMWVYQNIVSTDADNSISAGSDGGAYYDAP